MLSVMVETVHTSTGPCKEWILQELANVCDFAVYISVWTGLLASFYSKSVPLFATIQL